MNYISTRGGGAPVSFSEAIATGLAPDGGLFLPETYPRIEISQADPFDFAAKIMAPFTSGSFTENEVRSILEKSWQVFSRDDPAPLRQLDENLWLLELFHGPTLAFKDYGLQFLAALFEEAGAPLIVIGATSGDTGAAAVHALAGKKNVKLFMLHPEGRISDVQRCQMTTVEARNIFNIAIDGSFDDCQRLLKEILADPEFQGDQPLTTVNSINWGRILAQSVYYWWAVSSLKGPVHFIVPSGNFGDAFSGYVAMRCGAAVKDITIATNRNDILPRAMETGIYKPGMARETVSPAMDIQTASNFERLLFEETGRNGKTVTGLMNDLKHIGEYKISPQVLGKVKQFFQAVSVSEAETLAAIKKAHKAYDVIFDPHTAVGFAAMKKVEAKTQAPVVLLATAHPAKFPDAIAHAIGITPSLPASLTCLMDRKEHLIRLGADAGGLKAFIIKAAK